MANEAIKTKVCSRCSMELPLTEFPKNAQCRDGHSGVCKKCKAEQMKDYRRNLAEKARLYDERGGLETFTPRELMKELARRGYKGTLTYTETRTVDLTKIMDDDCRKDEDISRRAQGVRQEQGRLAPDGGAGR